MTTHKKRLSAGASSAVLLVALLAGCGSSSSDESSPSTDTSASAESSPSADATETDENTGPDDSSATVEAFCSDAQELIAGEAIDGVDPSDAAAVKTVVADMTAQIDASVAPEEIAADWELFSGGMKQFLSAIEAMTAGGETPDAAAQEQMDAATEFMSSAELVTAEENVDAYVAANCEA